MLSRKQVEHFFPGASDRDMSPRCQVPAGRQPWGGDLTPAPWRVAVLPFRQHPGQNRPVTTGGKVFPF